MRLSRLICFVICFTGSALLLATVGSAQMVERVVDGDTIVVGGVGRVRLIGVDTPETVAPRRPVQDFGMEASEFTRARAAGTVVRLDYDGPRSDRYGRTRAYVYLPDGTLLNAEIIRQGYGFADTRYPHRHLDRFRAHEHEARAAGRGLWAATGRAEVPAARTRPTAGAPACVDINSAGAADLQRIVHIGAPRAARILE